MNYKQTTLPPLSNPRGRDAELLRSCWGSTTKPREQLQQEGHGKLLLANSLGMLPRCNLVTFGSVLSFPWKRTRRFHHAGGRLQMKGKQEQRGRSAANVWLQSSLHQGFPSTQLRLSCTRSKMERFSWGIMSVSQTRARLRTAPSCCHHGEDGTRQPQVSVPHPGDTPGHQLLNPLPREHSERKAVLVPPPPWNYHKGKARGTPHPDICHRFVLCLWKSSGGDQLCCFPKPKALSLQTSREINNFTRKQFLTQVFLCKRWCKNLMFLGHSDAQTWRQFPLPPYRSWGKERWRWRRCKKS